MKVDLNQEQNMWTLTIKMVKMSIDNRNMAELQQMLANIFCDVNGIGDNRIKLF